MSDLSPDQVSSYAAGLEAERASYQARIAATDDKTEKTRLESRLDQVDGELKRVGAAKAVTPDDPETTEGRAAPERAVRRGRRGAAPDVDVDDE